MTTMNVSLPEKMKEFVDGRVEAGGYQTVSEYVRDLIRKDIQLQDKERNDRLDALLGVTPLAIGDLILVEVLQGFRQEKM